MIADDLELLVEDLSELLNKQEDMEVVDTANSGREIVELTRTTDADLILMDIEMEYLTSGITATDIILRENDEMKVIYLTSHDSEKIILMALGTGADDYIIKGMPEDDILHHIRSALEGRPLLVGKVQQVFLDDYRKMRSNKKNLIDFVRIIPDLTKAEKEIVSLLLKGKSNRQIANSRTVELSTVKTQIGNILKKFDCKRTKEIVTIIKELNLEELFL